MTPSLVAEWSQQLATQSPPSLTPLPCDFFQVRGNINMTQLALSLAFARIPLLWAFARIGVELPCGITNV